MSSDKNEIPNKELAKKLERAANGLTKGTKAFHRTQGHAYSVLYNTSKSTQVQVNALNSAGKSKWLLRLDKPHVGADFNHININSKFTGIKDPHIKLPPGGLNAGKGLAKTAKVINKVNKVLVPIAIAVDVAMVGCSAYRDIQNKTSRNTVETAASIAGGWGGGFGGAVGGAAIGTAFLPGVGTLIGGIVGSITGALTGTFGACKAVEIIGDEFDYDVTEQECVKCDRKFKLRKYLGEKETKFCPQCQQMMILERNYYSQKVSVKE